MRKLILVSLLLAACNITTTQLHAQITVNVAMRVLQIKVGDLTGTAFTMDVDGRQYLITAKHMVASSKAEDSIEILKSDGWSPLKVKVFPCAGAADIAVLVPLTVLTTTFPMEPIGEKPNLILGQDVYFVGFPHGMSTPTNQPFPLPLTKKGVVSAFTGTMEAPVILLDGYNNPGFSGSPIVFHDLSQPGTLDFYVAGVVSGFIPELVPVTEPELIKPGTDTSKIEGWRIGQDQNGQRVQLKDTDHRVPLNSGLVIGYFIKPAVDLIHQHPIGPKIN